MRTTQAVPSKSRHPRRRDPAATRQRLIRAVGTLLARRGFTALGINAVASEAGVDKVLIYRYFGGLPELLREFGLSGEFWPSVDEMVGADLATLRNLPLAKSVPAVMHNYIRAIRRRPLTREILAWESVERNELTRVLETIREKVSLDLFATVGIDVKKTPAVIPVTTLLAASVNYLVIRSRTIRQFNTMDISSAAGWKALEQCISTICAGCFGANRPATPHRN